jgi:hypothetical protein
LKGREDAFMAFGPEWFVVAGLVLIVLVGFTVARAFRRPRG